MKVKTDQTESVFCTHQWNSESKYFEEKKLKNGPDRIESLEEGNVREVDGVSRMMTNLKINKGR
jgi:hypothetical protein